MDQVNPAKYPRHCEVETLVPVRTTEFFAYLDRHSQLSAHMGKRSWMMGGGRMDMTTDEGKFQRRGSTLRLAGKAFGITIFLEEAVTEYTPPVLKAWETIGTPRLLIISHYRMGFDIKSEAAGSRLRIFIDYDLPRGAITRILGLLLGGFYARWCVKSMAAEAQKRFASPASA
jgi:hypothetical protein